MQNPTIKTRILDYVAAHGPMRRTDIIRYLRETIQGKDFDPIRGRGYYCVQFYGGSGFYGGCGNNYLVKPSRADKRFLKQNKDGLYYV